MCCTSFVDVFVAGWQLCKQNKNTASACAAAPLRCPAGSERARARLISARAVPSNRLSAVHSAPSNHPSRSSRSISKCPPRVVPLLLLLNHPLNRLPLELLLQRKQNNIVIVPISVIIHVNILRQLSPRLLRRWQQFLLEQVMPEGKSFAAPLFPRN